MAARQQLVMQELAPPQIVNNANIELDVRSAIMNGFLIDVPFAHSSYHVHPADSGSNLAQVLQLPPEFPVPRLTQLSHGYWIGRHMQLGRVPGIRHHGIIDIGSSAEDVAAFPPPPVEQGMRYTVDVDIPIENDLLAVQFLHHLRQGLQPHFGENLGLNLRNKRRIPHAPPGLPNNDLPPAPPNNGPPPPHNPGQDPHNNNINESYYDSKEESARLKQQERATLRRKKRKQREEDAMRQERSAKNKYVA